MTRQATARPLLFWNIWKKASFEVCFDAALMEKSCVSLAANACFILTKLSV